MRRWCAAHGRPARRAGREFASRPRPSHGPPRPVERERGKVRPPVFVERGDPLREVGEGDDALGSDQTHGLRSGDLRLDRRRGRRGSSYARSRWRTRRPRAAARRGGNTRCTRPSCSASSARIMRPESRRSSALPRPTQLRQQPRCAEFGRETETRERCRELGVARARSARRSRAPGRGRARHTRR